MTFWAKLLTFLVLGLSLIFATASAVNFAKREDWAEKFGKKEDKHKGELARKNDDIKEIKDTRDKYEQDFKKADLESSTRKKMLDQKEGELIDKSRRLIDAELDKETAKNDLAELQHKTAVIIQTNQVVSSENKTLHADNKRLLSELTAEQTRAGEYQKENGTLKKKNTQLAERLETAEDQIEIDREIFQELARRNIEVEGVVGNFNAVPKVNARVVTANMEDRLVILNAGSDQKVRKNFNFTIYRGKTYVAKVNVIYVEKNQCGARIVTLEGRTTIRSGDRAATRF